MDSPTARRLRVSILVALFCLGGLVPSRGADVLTLHARSRAPEAGSPAVERVVEWKAGETAIVVVDMWDDHWCKGAAARVAELAGPMNAVLNRAREMGVFAIHAPSSVVDFYEGSPQRKRAMEAPYAKPPVELSKDERWGTNWCWPDKDREPDLPIDDSDMGCDCKAKCELNEPWTRQIPTIEIREGDAISHDGQEVFNLLEERGIDNVIVMGVHLNMCVLGRPVAIRQLVNLGKNVVLMRDMTDTMYNSAMRPFASHFEGTDLVVEHVERYWCPTIESVDVVGGKAFRFAEDRRGK